MTGKHRRPRTTGRTLAATAAVLTAGALPLAAAGTAFASTAQDDPPAAAALPALPQLPLGLGTAAGPLAGPLAGAVPLAGSASSELTGALGSGELPTDALLNTETPAMRAGDAAAAQRTAVAAQVMTEQTRELAGQLAAAVPTAHLVGQVVPPASAGPGAELAPQLTRGGAVGQLTSGFSAHATQLAYGLAGQAQPMAQQLRQDGVPTVGDVTSTLSRTQMPMFGTVGNFTSAVPVSSLIGDDSSVMGALGAAGSL